MTHNTNKQTMSDLKVALDAVNRGSWEDLEAGLNVLDACLRELGFDQGAIDAVQSEISDALYVQNEVWIRICEPAMYQPTQSTGGDNYYYWAPRGNAWKDANSVDLGEGFYATSIKLALIHPKRIEAAGHKPACYRVRSGKPGYNTHLPGFRVWVVDGVIYLNEEEARTALGADKEVFDLFMRPRSAYIDEIGSGEWIHFRPDPDYQYQEGEGTWPILPSFLDYYQEDEKISLKWGELDSYDVTKEWHQWIQKVGLGGPEFSVKLPVEWLAAGQAALVRWASKVALGQLSEGPDGATKAYWAGIVAAQEGKEIEEAPKLGALLQKVDQYLSDRSDRPTQAELRREVRQALGQKA